MLFEILFEGRQGTPSHFAKVKNMFVEPETEI